LLNSLEGKRGVVRAKPPLPALEGFLGKPTVVSNVISLATVPVVMEKGAQHYADFGLGRSKGTSRSRSRATSNLAGCMRLHSACRWAT
jgi:formate dehydrogenase iron-sulfur subunit